MIFSFYSEIKVDVDDDAETELKEDLLNLCVVSQIECCKGISKLYNCVDTSTVSGTLGFPFGEDCLLQQSLPQSIIWVCGVSSGGIETNHSL